MRFVTVGVATKVLIRIIVALDRCSWTLLDYILLSDYDPLSFVTAGQENAQHGGEDGDSGNTTHNAPHDGTNLRRGASGGALW